MDPNRPISAEEKRRKNIEEGRGASIKGIIGANRKTSYEFSTSNPMWRASLETLDLDENNINDDTLIDFTRALEHNKTLKSLFLYQNPDDDWPRITERGWEALSNLLCNKSSIMSTYNSNHTLQDPGDYAYPLDAISKDLVESLELNENKDKVEVARQKILRTHFSCDNDNSTNVQAFRSLIWNWRLYQL